MMLRILRLLLRYLRRRNPRPRPPAEIFHRLPDDRPVLAHVDRVTADLIEVDAATSDPFVPPLLPAVGLEIEDTQTGRKSRLLLQASHAAELGRILLQAAYDSKENVQRIAVSN